MVVSTPAFCALMKGRMILDGGTRLSRIPTKVMMLTFTPAAIAEIHNPTGTMVKKNHSSKMMINRGIAVMKTPSMHVPP